MNQTTSVQARERAIHVLLVDPSDARRGVLRDILTPPQWEVREAGTYGEAVGVLDNREIGVTICDAELAGGNWQALLGDLQSRENPPRVIVSSRLADERLWAEVLNLGGFDVLAQPFEQSEVLRVASMAGMAWERGRAGRAVAAHCP